MSGASLVWLVFKNWYFLKYQLCIVFINPVTYSLNHIWVCYLNLCQTKTNLNIVEEEQLILGLFLCIRVVRWNIKITD